MKSNMKSLSDYINEKLIIRSSNNRLNDSSNEWINDKWLNSIQNEFDIDELLNILMIGLGQTFPELCISDEPDTCNVIYLGHPDGDIVLKHNHRWNNYIMLRGKYCLGFSSANGKRYYTIYRIMGDGYAHAEEDESLSNILRKFRRIILDL